MSHPFRGLLPSDARHGLFLLSSISNQEVFRVLEQRRRDLEIVARVSPELLRSAVAKSFWMFEVNRCRHRRRGGSEIEIDHLRGRNQRERERAHAHDLQKSGRLVRPGTPLGRWDPPRSASKQNALGAVLGG